MEQMALDYLLPGGVETIDMVENLRSGKAQVVAVNSEGVLLYHKEIQLYMMTAKTAGVARRFAALAEADCFAVVHNPAAAEAFSQCLGLKQHLVCTQAMWPHSTPPVVPSSGLEYRVLPVDMAEEIEQIYINPVGLEYIRDRLAAGVVIGAYIDGNLAGFIGRHSEGAMGMLEVKPEYRRRGIAQQLVAKMCAQLLEEGRVPFCQLVVGNEASYKLHKHMGFIIGQEPLVWF